LQKEKEKEKEKEETTTTIQEGKRKKMTMIGVNKVSKAQTSKVKFAKKPYILRLFSHLLNSMDKGVFLNADYHIAEHFLELHNVWLSKPGSAIIYKMDVLTKRDLCLIIKRCIEFYGRLDDLVKTTIAEAEMASFVKQALFLFRFFSRLLEGHGSRSGDYPGKEVAALESAVIQTITLVFSLRPLETADVLSVQQVEKFLGTLFERGSHLQELIDNMMIVYLCQNPSRVSTMIQSCATISPSSSLLPSSVHEFCGCVALGRALVSLLDSSLPFLSQHLVQLFFLSLYLQSSYEITVRLVGVQIAHLLSGRKYSRKNLEEQLQASSSLYSSSPSSSSPSLSTSPSSPLLSYSLASSSSGATLASMGSGQSGQGVSQSVPSMWAMSQGSSPAVLGAGGGGGGQGQGKGTGSISAQNPMRLEQAGFIDPEGFIPSSTHTDREVYLAMTKRYSAAVADRYKSYTNDVLLQLIEFNKNLVHSEDIGLMLEMISPWARNYGTVVSHPPRWIIRGVFNLALSHSKDPSLSSAIGSLWKQLVAADPKKLLPLAVDWIVDCCALELSKSPNLIDPSVIKMCCSSCLSFSSIPLSSVSQSSSSSSCSICNCSLSVSSAICV